MCVHSRFEPKLSASFARLPHLAKRSALMVSHHHDVFLHASAPSLLHLGTDQGFATFPNPLPCVRREQARFFHSPERPSPQRGFIPLDEFPPSVAVPHHCGLCPLAVTARHTRHRRPLVAETTAILHHTCNPADQPEFPFPETEASSATQTEACAFCRHRRPKPATSSRRATHRSARAPRLRERPETHCPLPRLAHAARRLHRQQSLDLAEPDPPKRIGQERHTTSPLFACAEA
jgi:hypothetical protein